MRLYTLALALLLLLPCSVQAQSAPLHIFVLAGQSNMNGRAEIPLTQEISNNVFMWKDGEWQTAIEPIQEGTHAGMALGFALELLRLNNPGYQVGLVPCAVFGSTIEQWQKGQPIYNECISKTLAALQGRTLAGVLFAQGEANTYTQASADSWVNLTLQFARDFRTDAGRLETPFLYAQLGNDPLMTDHPYWTYLQNLQPSVMNVSRPWIRMIKTKDLPNNAQHFLDFDTYSILGRRFAAMYYANFE